MFRFPNRVIFWQVAPNESLCKKPSHPRLQKKARFSGLRNLSYNNSAFVQNCQLILYCINFFIAPKYRESVFHLCLFPCHINHFCTAFLPSIEVYKTLTTLLPFIAGFQSGI